MNFNRFEFRNLTPDPYLKEYACTQLNRVMSLAPPGSMCVATLAKAKKGYCCSMEICSRFGPFLVRAESATTGAAIKKMLEKAEEKLVRWHERKFDRIQALGRLSGERDGSRHFPHNRAGTA